MERIVVDASVIAASFLEEDMFHQESQTYIDGLESGDYAFHLPTVVVVETIAAISRRVRINRLAILARAKKSLDNWEGAGRIALYPLDQDRMNRAVVITEQYRLRGMDSVIATLAEEMDMPLKSFDGEILKRCPRASA